MGYLYSSSPSRTYVAMCNKADFRGYYFRKFTLPERLDNTVLAARTYFDLDLNFEACVEKILTFEDYSNIKEEY